MRPSHLVVTVSLAVAASLAAPLAAQQTSAQKIEAARLLLEASQFDSATSLLKQVIDQDSTSRLQAYVWLGIVNHFAGRDSLARASFREAYKLDPNLQLQGVGELDPARLPAILTEAQAAAQAADSGDAVATDTNPRTMPATDPANADAGLHLPVARCLPGCVGVDRAPEFISMPRVSFPDNLRDAAARLDLVMRFVIDAGGRVDAKTIRITRTNVASLGSEITSALAHARFRPGRNAQGPVPVQVEMTFTSKAQGATREGANYVLGPPRRL